MSAPGAILSDLRSLVLGQNTLDDMHRYDRRWCGEAGYPLFLGEGLAQKNRWLPL